MNKLKGIEFNLDKEKFGNKASCLSALYKEGFNIPDFQVLAINENYNEEIIHLIRNKNISIRSGGKDSLPGLMQSFLNIKREDSLEYIKKVIDSSKSDIVKEVASYLNVSSETAVIFQKMIEKDDLIGSGIVSNYNPINLEKELVLSYGENVFCDEVVINGKNDSCSFKNELKDMISKIDDFCGKPQEVEFSITKSRGVEILQSRDLVFRERKKHRAYDYASRKEIGLGLNSNFGHVEGFVNFGDDNVSENSILCLKELNPADIRSLLKSRAVLSKNGDHNCHLAVLCRLLSKPYILNTKLNGYLKTGQKIALNTNNGKVFDLENLK